VPSRKFIYWNGRAIEDATTEDGGAMICDVVNALGDKGYCSEEACPFENICVSPVDAAFAEGVGNLVAERNKVAQDERALKSALMQGRIVIAGMLVYSGLESSEVALSGILHCPDDSESFLGGHCIVLTGWRPGAWEVCNSWGPAWGDGGYFWADTAYFLNPQLSSDFTALPLA
jgi:C1A family cysteine protease